ncbi:uncharacterized protein NECHADRAFT_88437 [Fusarium vanettenii 77-13-4]|uniref:C3H1-type domain-containing protein n=1 Tax=Fusarium vanettenii (strain ATCC MYA-4622 / CBS 123669 / FGSC 9596 / NRRL 45880 / 77-13-4) TaxID=660122 RepID=C7ZBI2_FUSV7|nr:uncharacterized protein NECHADRAFT_88437 [Fusarium vanettenii 77-13-4]EEU38530.1 hypothetical protein NECHADRAFT_88437 [Fusarium vanettenii 77-13-4]
MYWPPRAVYGAVPLHSASLRDTTTGNRVVAQAASIHLVEIVLIEDYRRLKSDYEEEREGRERYKQLARGQERNPFALVVIDGDGYVFDEHFVGVGEKGEEGGSRAVKQLVDSVKRSLRRKGLESCEVMVRVYANLVGLSKSLWKNGLCGVEKRSLSSFVAGFNRSYGLADFVDAGELKENADFKLKAILRLYADNAYTSSPLSIGDGPRPDRNLDSDWRRGSSNSLSKGNIESLPKREGIPEGFVAINRVGDRLDALLPTPSADSIKRLKALSAEKRFCNNKQLSGACENDDCKYEHNLIAEELKLALECLARSVPCPRRGGCRKANCVYGHVC